MKRALSLFATAAAVVAAGGWLIAATWHVTLWHGLYCAIGTASTVGCDTAPRSPAGWLAAVAVMLTAIPLLAAVFAWLTGQHAGRRASERAAEHVAEAERRLTGEADRRHVIMSKHVEHLVAAHCADLKEHMSAVAGAAAPPDQEDPASPPPGSERAVASPASPPASHPPADPADGQQPPLTRKLRDPHEPKGM